MKLSQGGGHGSGGDEILVKIEDRDIENETTIKFTLTTNTRVELNVYDVNSKLIKSLISPTILSKGDHIIIWDGRNDHGNRISRGVYYYRFKAGKKDYTQKIVFI
jgi:flagellar hook assembly protein FlgD